MRRAITGIPASTHRGFDRTPCGGVSGEPTPSKPFTLKDVLDAQVWQTQSFFMNYRMQTTMVQPVGGMDNIGKAFQKQVAGLINHNAKLTRVAQDKKGVTITHQDVGSGAVSEAKADWRVCTIPLGVLAQVDP